MEADAVCLHVLFHGVASFHRDSQPRLIFRKNLLHRHFAATEFEDAGPGHVENVPAVLGEMRQQEVLEIHRRVLISITRL